MEAAMFYLFAFVIFASALAVVTMRNIFHCALFLILCLSGVAGLYVLLHAEFLAVIQILLYVGAVAVLMIFAIMLTSRLAGRETELSNELPFIGGFLAFIFAIISWSFLSRTFFRTTTAIPPEDTTRQIGTLLMTDYVLPFELVSVLLLAALIGAIIIARREGN